MYAYFLDVARFYHSYKIVLNSLNQGDVHESLILFKAKSGKLKFVAGALENVHDANHG